MLISKTVKIKQNARIKSHYVKLGYVYTKMGDEFEVKVNDLTNGSNVKVTVSCDYCHNLYEVKWYSYLKLKDKSNNKDCCGNPTCTGIKAKESIFLKYGVKNVRDIPHINDKISKTNLEKYGAENPFGSEIIQEKIRKTNIKKYSVENALQNLDVQEKYKHTCLEKYGVDNYSKTKEFRESMRGENSPVQKGNDTKTVRTERMLPEYRDQRKAVFARDHYVCQHCGDKNGNGHEVYLEAHHLDNFKDYIDERFDIDNGVTLCRTCHKLFHSIYGIKNTNKEQFYEFQNNK